MEEIRCEHEEVCGCCDVDHDECEHFAPKVDREEILKIAEDMERNAYTTPNNDGLSLSWLLDEFSSQIREAIGEEK